MNYKHISKSGYEAWDKYTHTDKNIRTHIQTHIQISDTHRHTFRYTWTHIQIHTDTHSDTHRHPQSDTHSHTPIDKHNFWETVNFHADLCKQIKNVLVQRFTSSPCNNLFITISSQIFRHRETLNFLIKLQLKCSEERSASNVPLTVSRSMNQNLQKSRKRVLFWIVTNSFKVDL